jgi:2'-5' RNA ligase
MNPAQYHITLRFVGKTNAELLDRIKTGLSCIEEPAFELSLVTFGTFPDAAAGRTPRVLWVRPGESPALAALQARVETAVREAIGGSGQKAFSPHVTLARFRRPPAKEQLEQWFEDVSRFEEKPFAVKRFHLYDSELTPDGAIHTILANYPLS